MSTEIKLFLSGGASNLDPDLSLGGPISNTRVSSSSLNNLFDDLTETEILSGVVDFRCFYLKNTSSRTVRDVSIHINSEVEGGAFIELAVERRNDLQQVSLVSEGSGPTGGSFTITFDGSPVEVAYNSNLTTWATAFKNVLLSETDLEEVAVTASEVTASDLNYILFSVNFTGEEGGKSHPLMSVASNDLTGDPTTEIEINKLVRGGPINSEAISITNSTTAPSGLAASLDEPGIYFYIPTKTSPINIGNLEVNDTAAIWVKRQAFPSTVALADDGFSFAVFGKTEL